MNIASYVLGNAYTALSPALNAAASVCTVNGEQVPCPEFLNFLGPSTLLIFLVLIAVIIAANWKIFTKAGQPGWASIVPIYNLVVMLRIVKKPTWWVILYFIPFVNFVVSLIIIYELAKAFGKGLGFTVGLVLLPIIFYPILGFGKATYQPGPVSS